MCGLPSDRQLLLHDVARRLLLLLGGMRAAAGQPHADENAHANQDANTAAAAADTDSERPALHPARRSRRERLPDRVLRSRVSGARKAVHVHDSEHVGAARLLRQPVPMRGPSDRLRVESLQERRVTEGVRRHEPGLPENADCHADTDRGARRDLRGWVRERINE